MTYRLQFGEVLLQHNNLRVQHVSQFHLFRFQLFFFLGNKHNDIRNNIEIIYYEQLIFISEKKNHIFMGFFSSSNQATHSSYSPWQPSWNRQQKEIKMKHGMRSSSHQPLPVGVKHMIKSSARSVGGRPNTKTNVPNTH